MHDLPESDAAVPGRIGSGGPNKVAGVQREQEERIEGTSRTRGVVSLASHPNKRQCSLHGTSTREVAWQGIAL